MFAFGPRALRRLVERAGFEAVETVNATLAGPAPGTDGWSPASLARATIRGVAHGAAAAVATGSAGRWLAAPSIEVYARRRRDPSR